MLIKILLIFFLLQSSIEDDLPKIELIGIENPKCSNLLGRVDFKAKCRYDSLPTSDSYYILDFKDSSNNKHSSICKITNPDIPRPTSEPIQPTEPIGPIPETIPGTEVPPVPGTGDVPPVPGTGDVPPVPGTGEVPPVPGTEEVPGTGEVPPSHDSSDHPDFSDTPQTDTENKTEPFDPEYEKFRDILLKLRLRLEDNIKDLNEDVNATLNKDKLLKPLLFYKGMEILNNFTLKLDNLDLILQNFSENFIYPKIDEDLIKLKKLIDIDIDLNFSELNLNISDKVCSFTKEFIEAGSKDNTIINIIRKDLQEKNVTKLLEEKKEKLNATFEQFKKSADEKLDSPFVNNLLNKISEIGQELDKKVNNSQIEELIEKMKQWEEFKENPINETKEYLQRVQSALFDKFIDKVNSTMIEFDVSLIDNLLKIQKSIDSIKNGKNGSLIENLEEKTEEELEDLKDSIKNKLEFLNDSEIVKILKENFELYKDEVVQKLKDAGLYNHIEEVQKRIKELKDLNELVKNKNNTINNTAYEILELIKTFNSYPPVLDNFNLSEIDVKGNVKNLTLIQALVEKLISSLNPEKLGEDWDKMKKERENTISSIEKKINDFLNDDSSLKGIKQELKKILDQLKNSGLFTALLDYSGNNTQLEDSIEQRIIHNVESLKKVLYFIDEKLKGINRTAILEVIEQTLPKNISGLNLEDIIENLNKKPVCELLIEKLKNLDIENITETLKNEIIENITLLQKLTDYDYIKQKFEEQIDKLTPKSLNGTDSPLKDALLNYTSALKEFLGSFKNLSLFGENDQKDLNQTIYDVIDKIKEIDGEVLLEKIQSHSLYTILNTTDPKLREVEILLYLEKILRNNTGTTSPILLKLEEIVRRSYPILNESGMLDLINDVRDRREELEDSMKNFTKEYLNDSIYLIIDQLNDTVLADLLKKHIPELAKVLEEIKNKEITAEKDLFKFLEKCLNDLEAIAANNPQLEPLRIYINLLKKYEILEKTKNYIFSIEALLKKYEPEINQAKVLDFFEDKIKKFNGEKFLEDLEIIQNPLKDLLAHDFTKFYEDMNICFDTLKEKVKENRLLSPIINQIAEKYTEIKSILDKAGVPDKHIKYHESLDNLKLKLNDTINEAFEKLKEKFNNKNNSTSFNLTESLMALSDKIFNDLEKTKELVKNANTSTLLKLKDDIINSTCIFCEWKNQTGLDHKLITNKTIEFIKSRINLVYSLKNMNISNPIQEHLYEFKEQLENLNDTEFILELNKTLFNISEEVINVLDNKTKLEEFESNLLFILNLVMAFEKNKTFIDVENDLNDLIAKIKEHTLKGIIKKINNSLYTCNYEYIEEITGIKRLKQTFNLIKDLTTNKDEIKEKLEIIKEDFKSHAITYLIGDNRYNLIQDKVQELNQTVMDTLSKMGLDEFVKDLQERISKLKNLTEKAEEEEEMNEFSYKLKDLNTSQIVDGINATFQKYKNEVHNLREIEYFSEKIRYILEKVNLTGLSKKKLNKIKETIEEAKQKAENLDRKVLAKIIEEINIQCDKILENENVRLDIIDAQVDEFLDECKQLEIKIREFPNATQEEDYNKAKEKLQKELNLTNIIDKLDYYVTREIDKLNETLFYVSEFMDLVREKTKNIPEDKKEEFHNEIKELFKENTEELEKYIEENSHIIELIKSIKENSTNLNDLEDFIEKLKNSTEQTKEKAGKIKSIADLINNIRKDPASNYREELEESILKGIPLLNSIDIEALRSILNKLRNKNSASSSPLDINMDKIREEISNIISKIKNVNNNNKDSLDNLSSDLASLIEKLNSAVSAENIKNLIDNLRNQNDDKNPIDLTSLLQELSKLNLKDTNIKEEIEKIQNIITLIKELNELLNNPRAQQIIKALLDSGLLKKRALSEIKEKKVKKQKKSKKNVVKRKEKIRRVDSQIGTFDCKLDHFFTSPQKLTAYSENINSKVLLNKDTYNIDIVDNITLDLGNDEIGCSNSSYLKGIVKYIRNTEPQKDTQKKRLIYDLYSDISDNYAIPPFFYVLTKLKVTFNNGTEGEIDSYCVLEDSSNRRNSKFKCYAYPENFDDYNKVSDIDSYYIEIPENSNSTDDRTPSINYFRKGSSNGLSAGAIVGIILACLAVLVAILVTIICVNKNARPAVVAASTTDSQNHLQVANYSGQYGQYNVKV